MQQVADRIREKIDIVQYIGQFVQLKHTGRNFKGLCPFHQEKTSSFIVSSERQIWHCFGACGTGGDVISFLMKYENITFPEAIQELAKQAGIPIDTKWHTADSTDKEAILTLNALVSQYYHYILLNSPVADAARKYLEKRTTKKEIWETFEMGYAPESWNSLFKYLRKKGYSEKIMNAAGLIIQGKRGNWYDRFRGRLIFPIKNMQGRVIGFSGRVLDAQAEEAKYINSPETVAYHKRESLFGIHIAKDAIRKQDRVILVEGEFDMITSYQHGVGNIVAIKGSAVTHEQLNILKRLTNKIYLCLDSDAAGIEATRRAINEAEGMDIEIHVLSLSQGKDPDEAIRQDPLAFKHAFMHSKPVYDFLIDTAVQKYTTNNPFAKKHIADEVMPLVAQIKNPIIQSYYIKKTGIVLEVSEDSVQKTLRQYWQQQRKRFSVALQKETKIPKQMPRHELIEQYILSILLQGEDPYDLLTILEKNLAPGDFQSIALSKIYLAFLEYKRNHKDAFLLQTFMNGLPQELRETADRVFLFASSTLPFSSEDVEKLALEVRRNALRHRLQEASNAPENGGQSDSKTNAILTDLKAVEKKLLQV